ncbi:MAG: diguanylate cyclase [Betaproteobacteria bacterium]|nr:diguanylate cyclase [Betaproteobacteria bacterium]
MKVLVVDKSPEASDLFRLLTEIEVRPIPASSIQEALNLYSVEQPDLVLLDLAFSEHSVSGFVRDIRMLEMSGKWTPVLVVSPRGAMAPDALKEALEQGADDVLYKPFDNVELVAKIVFLRRFVQMSNFLVVFTHKLDTANHELKRLSSLDRLTGLPCRAHFEEVLELEWRRSARQKNELALVMCDMDYFEAYNSSVGQVAADDVLRRIARLFEGSMERGGDSVARYGGQKFSVLLPMTGLSGAVFVAERLRRALMELQLLHDSSPYGLLTASFGAASCVVGSENRPDILLDATLLALNQAKQNGRNCVRRVMVTETGAFETPKDAHITAGNDKQEETEEEF